MAGEKGRGASEELWRLKDKVVAEFARIDRRYQGQYDRLRQLKALFSEYNPKG